VDARSDIYALACVLYECLTGRPPFPGGSPESQVAAHLTERPPRPSEDQRGLSPKLDDVIATGMAKDPKQRYATTVELARAARDAITAPLPKSNAGRSIERPTDPVSNAVRPLAVASMRTPSRPYKTFVPPHPPTAVATPQPPAKSRRRVIIAAAAGVVVVAGALTFVLTRNHGSGTADTAGKSPPSSNSTAAANGGPWAAYAFVANAFPDLIAGAPAGLGYQDTACYPVDDRGNRVDAASVYPFPRIRCDKHLDTGVTFGVKCAADRSVLTVDSARISLIDAKSEKWTRGEGSSGELQLGTTTGKAPGPGLVVAFNEPSRNFCNLVAYGGTSTQDLYDNWWKNAPI
jgi:hypothetical protein